jgi:hypothetical protein
MDCGFWKKFVLCALPALWQIGHMSTLTIELPDDLAARLEAASVQTRVPPAQLVRAALEKALPAPAPAPVENGEPSALEALQDLVGCMDSGVTDRATNPKYMEGFGQWRR